MLRRYTYCALAMILLTEVARAGQGGPPPTAFDVASVKQNDSGGQEGVFRVEGGTFRVQNLSLRSIIQFAYRIRDYQLIDAPGWAAQRYDVNAAFTGPASDVRAMLQHLLADRFGLRVRGEKRNLQAYELVRAQDDRLGPNLARSTGECPETPAPPVAGQPPRCTMFANNTFIMLFQRPLSLLLPQLEQLVHAPVVDKTGLAGNFDLTLRWAGPADRADDLAVGDTAALFTALVEQAGLRLQSARLPIDVLVVEQVRRPAPD